MKIVILGTSGDFTAALYHEVEKRYHVERVIIEESESRIAMAKRRIPKLGLKTVLGQILFKLWAVSILNIVSKKRIREIAQKSHMNFDDIPKEKITHVKSTNSAECITILKRLSPDLILVMGTRILSEELLNAVSCDVVNMHMGITPLYRGVHGAYWALAEQDREHCGVTIHMVDKGIDTGSIIAQERIFPTKEDTFLTYPYLQFAAGVNLIIEMIRDFEISSIKTYRVDLPSKLRTHPTLMQYLKCYLRSGIK